LQNGKNEWETLRRKDDFSRRLPINECGKGIAQLCFCKFPAARELKLKLIVRSGIYRKFGTS
jgi:hypothetical protein